MVILTGRQRLLALLLVLGPLLVVTGFAAGCSSSGDNCDCDPETETPYCSDCGFE